MSWRIRNIWWMPRSVLVTRDKVPVCAPIWYDAISNSKTFQEYLVELRYAWKWKAIELKSSLAFQNLMRNKSMRKHMKNDLIIFQQTREMHALMCWSWRFRERMKAVAENIGLRSLQDDFGEVCQLTLVKSKKKNSSFVFGGAAFIWSDHMEKLSVLMKNSSSQTR